MNEQSQTPRTDAWAREGAYLKNGSYADVAHKQFIHIDDARQLEKELQEAQEKLAFLESKGLTVGKMKTSDKPEPYLVYVCAPCSEFDDTIHVNKVIDAEIERDTLRRENAELAATEVRLRADLQWFIERVDKGEVRSRKSYERFKLSISTPPSDALKPWVEFISEWRDYCDANDMFAFRDQARALLKQIGQ